MRTDHHVYSVPAVVTVEAENEDAATASVGDFWQRACVTTAHVTKRGVLTSLRAGAATESGEDPVYSRRELVGLTAVAAQVALVVVDVLT